MNFAISRDIMTTEWYAKPSLVSLFLFLQIHSTNDQTIKNRRIVNTSLREISLWTGVKAGFVFEDNCVKFRKPGVQKVLNTGIHNEEASLSVGKDFTVIQKGSQLTFTWNSARPYNFVYVNGDEINNFEWRDMPKMLSIYLTVIMTASFRTTRYHGKEVKRGSVITSQANIQSYTGLNRSVVRWCLDKLVENELLTILPSLNSDGKAVKRHGSTLVLNNYDKVTVEPGSVKKPVVKDDAVCVKDVKVEETEATKNIKPQQQNTTKKDNKKSDDKRFLALSNIVREAKVNNLVAIRNIDAMSYHIFNEYMKARYESFTLSEEDEAKAINDAWIQIKGNFQEKTRSGNRRNEIKVDDILRYVRYEDEQAKNKAHTNEVNEVKSCAAFVSNLVNDALNINDNVDALVIAGYLSPLIPESNDTNTTQLVRDLYSTTEKKIIIGSIMLYFEKVKFTGEYLQAYRREVSRLLTIERYEQLLQSIRDNYSRIIKAKSA